MLHRILVNSPVPPTAFQNLSASPGKSLGTSSSHYSWRLECQSLAWRWENGHHHHPSAALCQGHLVDVEKSAKMELSLSKSCANAAPAVP